MRRGQVAERLVVTVVALVAFVFCVAAAWGLPPFTTGPKSSPPGTAGQAELYRVGVGCHATYDRLVLRFRFAKPGYRVESVTRVAQDPSGRPVPLLGSARLLVVVRAARAHTAAGTAALVPAVVSPLCTNLRQVKKVGDFEGVVSFGLGLRHAAGFRVFRLQNPTRIVIDIAP
jgi:hypothetical protein